MFMRVRRQIGAVRVILCITAMVLSVVTVHGAGKGTEPAMSVSKHATIPAPRIAVRIDRKGQENWGEDSVSGKPLQRGRLDRQ